MQPYANRLNSARQRAAGAAESDEYGRFVEFVRAKTPNRFSGQVPKHFLRLVDHHLLHFVPNLLRSVDGEIRRVFDFGCGTGASSVALAMVFPEAQFQGMDISEADVAIAEARSKLYGVDDRCHFMAMEEGQALPHPGDQFDLCVCCSVLEYVTDPDVRRYCVQEMARIIVPGGLLFMTVPNRIYPVEIHKRKLGWNYFPKWLKAEAVGSTAWEVRSLARPHRLKLHRTPLLQLIKPWTNFCLKKDG